MKAIIDRMATFFLWLIGILILALLVWFIGFTLYTGLPHVSWTFLTAPPSEILAGGGVGPELFNTFYIVFLSLVFSIPLGVGAGIYLAEYAGKSRLTDLVRLSTESLASVPSLIFGMFGMLIFVYTFKLGFTIIGGAISLALLNLPVLVRVTEEALKAIDPSYREASTAMGATKWQTIWKVLLPTSLPNLMTGVTLVAGRALGETAVLIVTAGLSVSNKMFDFNPLAMGETLAVHLWYVRAEGLVPDASEIASGSAAVLIVVVLIFNLGVRAISYFMNRKVMG